MWLASTLEMEALQKKVFQSTMGYNYLKNIIQLNPLNIIRMSSYNQNKAGHIQMLSFMREFIDFIEYQFLNEKVDKESFY